MAMAGIAAGRLARRFFGISAPKDDQMETERRQELQSIRKRLAK
jgi:hypothetical protein